MQWSLAQGKFFKGQINEDSQKYGKENNSAANILIL